MTITQHATLLLVLLVSVQGFWNLNDFVQRYPNLLCNNTVIAQYIEQCPKPSTTRTRTTTTPTFWTTGETGTQSSASTSSVFTIGVTPTTDPTASVETTSATPLEQAHWCRLENGSAFALSYSFMLDPCTVCQCTQTRVIRCTRYPCMTAYCIDNSPPVQRPGQCCAQCAYENNSNTCTVGTTKVPHGTIVRGPTSNGERCWCQMGTIECRRFAALATNGWGLWGDGMVLYLVLILMLILLVVGTLSCVACSVYFYYYYKKQNQVANEEYQQYWNQAGWQPMDADGQVDQKKLEAEQQQQGAGMGDAVAGTDPEYIPPPYAAYNGAYPNERS